MLRHLAVGLLLALAVGACSTPGGSESTSTSRSTTPSPVTSSPSTTAPRPLDAALVADIQDVRRVHEAAEVSVALAPVGSSERPRVLGDAPPLVAWSTIKVPLALAVLRSGHEAPADIIAALTASDNAAAQRLWESLGSGAAASDAVERELRRGGDSRTEVPSEVTVPGYSAFGQTTWRLADQASFAAALPCLPGAARVTEAMGGVVGGQRWGLGGVDDARLKGGWGPTPEGYVVRQLGIVPGAKGGTAAAVQVRTGTHAQGTAIMDEVAAVIEQHRTALPTGSCT